MGRVSFDNGKTFIDAQELSRDDLSKVRNLKHMLSEDVFAELHRCQSAAKAWYGPLKFDVDDIVLKKCIELSRYDLILEDNDLIFAPAEGWPSSCITVSGEIYQTFLFPRRSSP